MRSLNDIRVGPRLIGGFASVALLCAIVGIGGVLALSRVQNRMERLYADRIVPLEQLNVVSDRYAVDIVDVANKASSGLVRFSDAQRTLQSARDTIRTRWAAYRATVSEPGELTAVDEAEAMMREADTQLDALDGIFRAEDFASLSIFTATELYPLIDPITDRLQDLAALQLEGARRLNEEAGAAYTRAKLLAFGLILLAITIALGLGVTIARSIVGMVRDISGRAESLRTVCVAGLGRASDGLSKGELDVEIRAVTKPIRTARKDELGDLARTVDGMIEQTQATIESAARAQQVIRDLVAETRRLADAGRDGDLTVRGDTARFGGAYGELVKGMNETLDAVVEPMQEAAQVLERLAARDLTARVQGDYRGDHARIKEALNRAVATLDGVLTEVSGASEEVAAASQQISQGSQSLAEGASEQASALEEVSSSLQELSSMARQNVGNAKEAQSLAEGARQSAQRGVSGMQSLTQAMERIKASSDATAKIVRTIDEIAFQTNLLALNAAVEAARAGDAGKGFAVVAEEVRSLAMRSAEAAKNTAALIEESVGNAENGVELNADVLRQLGDIAAQVNRVGEVMGEIAAASEQQSDGVGQINGAVEQMNGVTQGVASSSEESAAAAEELSGQSSRVRELVGSFELSATPSRGKAMEARASRPAASRPKKNGTANGRRAAAKVGNGNGAASATTLIPLDDDDFATLGEF